MKEIAATNAILGLLVLKPTENNFVGIEVTAKQSKWKGKVICEITGLEFRRPKRGVGSHTEICQYICCV